LVSFPASISYFKTFSRIGCISAKLSFPSWLISVASMIFLISSKSIGQLKALAKSMKNLKISPLSQLPLLSLSTYSKIFLAMSNKSF